MIVACCSLLVARCLLVFVVCGSLCDVVCYLLCVAYCVVVVCCSLCAV